MTNTFHFTLRRKLHSGYSQILSSQEQGEHHRWCTKDVVSKGWGQRQEEASHLLTGRGRIWTQVLLWATALGATFRRSLTLAGASPELPQVPIDSGPHLAFCCAAPRSLDCCLNALWLHQFGSFWLFWRSVFWTFQIWKPRTWAFSLSQHHGYIWQDTSLSLVIPSCITCVGVNKPSHGPSPPVSHCLLHSPPS